MADPQRMTINISTATFIKIVVLGLLFVLLYTIRDILLIVVISVVLASAMDPLVDWLYRKAKFPRGLSVLLVYVIFLGIVGTVIYFLIPPLVEQFNQLAGRMQGFRDAFGSHASSLTKILDQLGVTNSFSSLTQTFSKYTSNLFQTTVGFFNGLIETVSVLVISFYLISSENGLKNFVRSFVPFKHQAYAISLTHKIQNKIGYWLLGQLVLSGFIFLLDFIGLSILGVKFALALALLAGLLEIVPYLGPILSAIPGIFVAFVQSPPLALVVAGLYFVVQQMENYILVPKIMGRSVGANPVVILIAVLVGFKLAGVLGMLLAVPIVAAGQVFINDFLETREHG